MKRKYGAVEKELLRRYKGGGSLYARLRLRLGHYGMFEESAPVTGRILDFGCGIGQLGLFLKLVAPSREVYGFDISAERIAKAKNAADVIRGIYFLSDTAQLPDCRWNAVIFYDMLHYLPREEQDALIVRYAAKVAPDGALIIRDVFRSRGLRYVVSLIHEKVMTSIRFTPTESTGLYFRRAEELAALLESLGLDVNILPPPPLHPYADYLIVARKTG